MERCQASQSSTGENSAGTYVLDYAHFYMTRKKNSYKMHHDPKQLMEDDALTFLRYRLIILFSHLPVYGIMRILMDRGQYWQKVYFVQCLSQCLLRKKYTEGQACGQQAWLIVLETKDVCRFQRLTGCRGTGRVGTRRGLGVDELCRKEPRARVAPSDAECVTLHRGYNHSPDGRLEDDGPGRQDRAIGKRVGSHSYRGDDNHNTVQEIRYCTQCTFCQCSLLTVQDVSFLKFICGYRC